MAYKNRLRYQQKQHCLPFAFVSVWYWECTQNMWKRPLIWYVALLRPLSVVQSTERSESDEVNFIKEVVKKILIVISRPARLLECLVCFCILLNIWNMHMKLHFYFAYMKKRDGIYFFNYLLHTFCLIVCLNSSKYW